MALSVRGDVGIEGPVAQAARLAFRFLFIVVCLAAIGWAVSNCRQVPPDSRAVVLRFGSVDRQQGPGLLLAWPRPIEQVLILPSAEQQIAFKIERFEETEPIAGGKTVMVAAPTGSAPAANVTYNAYSSFALSDDPRKNTGFLLTGDASVVHLQATLFYQIVDPAAYVIAAAHVEPALQRLFIASAVAVCAARDLDTILVARPELGAIMADAARAGREQLRADLMTAVNRRLDDLAAQGAGLGIRVSRVDLAAAIPSVAKSAFDLVLIATQWAERDIAQARTEAETTAQKAKQESDRILAEAQAKAQEQVTEAQARTAAIAALAPQAPGASGQMLVNRIYYDRIGALLGKAGWVDTVDARTGAHLLLPGPAEK